MARDMTRGNPLKLIVSFCIPLMLGTLFQQLYSMVDAIVVGKFVGVNALAGVGSTGAVNFLILGFANGVCSGFSIMYGQRYGAKDYEGMRNYMANAIYLSVGIAAVLTPLTVIFCRPILLFMDTPLEIIDEAYGYIVIIFAGIAVLMMYNCAAAILRSIGDSRTPVIALVVAAILNIILDLLFVIVFHMGVYGVAVATVISQGISGAACFVYMFKKYEVLRFRKGEWQRDTEKMRRLLGVGLPMALQFSITAIGSVIMQMAVNGLGAVSVAAMAAAGRVNMIFGASMESIGLTMATFCSQNMGALKFERIRKGIKISIVMEVVFSLFGLVMLNLFGTTLALLFIDASEVEVMEMIQVFLRITSAFYVLLGILYVLRNSIQGMGYGVLPMFAGISELVGRFFVAYALVGPLGFIGVTLANPVAWVAADILLIGVYMYIRKTVLIEHRKMPPGFSEQVEAPAPGCGAKCGKRRLRRI